MGTLLVSNTRTMYSTVKYLFNIFSLQTIVDFHIHITKDDLQKTQQELDEIKICVVLQNNQYLYPSTPLEC